MNARDYVVSMTTSVRSRGEEARELVAIVDDDPSVRQSMDRLVRSLGHRTRVFGSGDEFLASTAPEQAACLLLDVRMPGMDGLTVQRRLVEGGARIGIVFITALATDEEERRAWSAGAVGFLRKPVGQAALRHALDGAFRAARSARGDEDVE
jgi:FixJ family two-component response regulator